jgi:tetratricopeptide (TPR) repeat protein
VLASIEGALGVAYELQRNVAASDSAFERAIALLTADSVRFGEDLAVELVNYGSMVGNRGDHRRAAALKRRALYFIAASNGATHVSSAELQSRLAQELLDLGQLKEAAILVDSAVTSLEASAEPIPDEIVYALRIRARIQLAARQYAGAARTIATATQMLPRVQSIKSDLTFDFLILDADTRLARGDRTAARRLVQEALTLARATYAPANTRTRRAEQRLAALDSATVLSQ